MLIDVFPLGVMEGETEKPRTLIFAGELVMKDSQP